MRDCAIRFPGPPRRLGDKASQSSTPWSRLVLTWADYSYVQPATSFSYAIIALLGWMFLGEVITPLRAFGIATICLGVFIVGRTPPRTTEVKLS